MLHLKQVKEEQQEQDMLEEGVGDYQQHNRTQPLASKNQQQNFTPVKKDIMTVGGGSVRGGPVIRSTDTSL